jgi:hypothetical protein
MAPSLGLGLGLHKYNQRSWITPELRDKFLFLWTGKFDGDNLLSDLDSTAITVTGKDFTTSYIPYTSAATFAVPDNATFEAADTDLMWFDSGGTPKTIAVKQLVNFDYERTLIKFDDSSPYHVRMIGILKAGETLTEDEVDRVHRGFYLWVYWSGVENDYGHYKDNRTIVDVPAISSAQVPPAQPTKVEITFDLNLDEDTVPVTTDFALIGSVTGAKTISDVDVNGAVVTLTVSVGFGDETVSLSYTQPTDNALRSALGGGEVVSIVAQSVTNNLYGPELVTNGAFTTDTAWTRQVTAGTIVIDGKLNFNAISTGNAIYQGAVVVTGNTYKVVYTIDSISAGFVWVYVKGAFTSTKNSAGTYTQNVVAGAASANIGVYSAQTPTTAVIDNLSIKEVKS